jgi:NADPH-dependent 2,4-dienoyl-CoA reductase/sulfur reductase-like enzyme
MTINRRDFLKVSGAGAASTLIAGCATQSAPTVAKASPKVVVVGAGFGGATCAKYLRTWGPNIEVTLIDPNDNFISCPISNWVIGGMKTMADITRSYDKLPSQYGVKMVKDYVVAIDTKARIVKTKGGGSFSYDRLVLSPGVDIRTDLVGGFKEAEAAGKVVHAWKAGAQTALLRKQLVNMPDGGVFVMSVPTVPYRCPPGPYERASLVAAYFTKAKPKSKIILLDGNPDIVSKKPLFMGVWNTLYKGMIDYRPNNAPYRVNGDTMTVTTEFDEVKGDVLNVVPPQRAGAVCEMAGVRTAANDNWCPVNLTTFESTTTPNVHIIGDSVSAALPKSGHMANNMAKVCASAIVELLAGRNPDTVPVIANTCYSAVSDTKAGYVANVWRWEGAKGYVSQPDGGATAVPDELNKAYNESWASNIWSDVLG